MNQLLDEKNDTIDDAVIGDDEKPEPSKRKIAAVDTGGNVTYSLIVGSILDYCAGLDVVGILVSRGYATAVNSVTGGPYGWWRERVFKATKTKEKSGKIRKTLADLLAFNTFQVPIYATALTVASLVSEGKVDWEKVRDGATYLATISPLIAPTMGWYMDGFRKVFGVKSAAEGAYKSKENK
ncbi:L-alanine exporter AlaE [Candidatus Woesearchaeota archaeon]|nr:L-alanine exporter AlaE [Candidatus Woesearchaeota archaeon]